MPARGECATAGDVDDIAVRLGAGDVLGRNVSAGSDLVLHQDGAVIEVRPDLFRDPARDEVRSAAGSEADDKVNVLRWVGLCERIISESSRFSDVADALNTRLRRVSRGMAPITLFELVVAFCASSPRLDIADPHDLNRSATDSQSIFRTAVIARNDAMTLSYHANANRMAFTERATINEIPFT